MPSLLNKICCARRCLHRDLQGRVLEKTLKRYSYIFDRFAEFAETCAIIEDLDELETLESLIQEFRDAENLSKNLHQRLVTATEFYMPRFKSRLKV